MNNFNRALVGLLAGVCLLAGCDDDEDDIVPTDAGGVARGGAGGTAAGGAGGTGGGGADAADAGDASADGPGDAVAAGPRGAGNPPVLGAQIDRMGRPAISTATVDTFTADAVAKGAVKDAYNAAAPAAWGSFMAKIRTSLGILDGLDGVCGNQLAADASSPRYTSLATVLADDQLYVNSGSGKCGIYLGLEAELVIPTLSADLKGSCGGRTPLDDVIERSYSLLAAGVLTGVDDTIIKDNDPVAPNLTTFPWLAAPTP